MFLSIGALPPHPLLQWNRHGDTCQRNIAFATSSYRVYAHNRLIHALTGPRALSSPGGGRHRGSPRWRFITSGGFQQGVSSWRGAMRRAHRYQQPGPRPLRPQPTLQRCPWRRWSAGGSWRESTSPSHREPAKTVPEQQGSTGSRPTGPEPEQKAAASQASRGRGPEQRAAASQASRGRGPEQRAAASQASRGRAPEQKAAASQASRGRAPEQKAQA